MNFNLSNKHFLPLHGVMLAIAFQASDEDETSGRSASKAHLTR